MMKRMLSILLAGMMVVGMLTGCGGTDNETAAEPAATEEAASEEATDELVTIKWLMAGDVVDEAEVDLIIEEANKLTEPKIGVTIDADVIDFGSYTDKLSMMMASGGTEFDICFTSNWCNPYTDAVASGAFYDITELLAETPDLQATINDYFWDGVTIDGSIYGVPNMQIACDCIALVIKKDLAEKYNLDYENITSVSDPKLIEFLDQVAANEPGIVPVAEMLESKKFIMWPSYNEGSTDALYYQYGGGMGEAGAYGEDSIPNPVYIEAGDDSQTVKCMTKEEYTEYLAGIGTWLNEWYNKGYIREDYATADLSADRTAGKYAIDITSWKPGLQEEKNNEFDYETVCVRVTTPVVSGGGLQGTIAAISQSCENPLKALQLLEMVNTDPELYNLLAYGIEGRHYELTEAGQVVKNTDSGYYGNDWAIGSIYNGYTLEGQSLTVKEETKEVNDTAVRSELLGFSMVATPETEMAALALKDAYAPYDYWMFSCDDVEATAAEVVEAIWPYVETISAEMMTQAEAYQAGLK